MNNRLFDIPLQQSSFLNWSNRHIGHYKKMQVSKETYGNAPDLRALWCLDCMEIFIMGFIIEGGLNE